MPQVSVVCVVVCFRMIMLMRRLSRWRYYGTISMVVPILYAHVISYRQYYVQVKDFLFVGIIGSIPFMMFFCVAILFCEFVMIHCEMGILSTATASIDDLASTSLRGALFRIWRSSVRMFAQLVFLF